MRKERKGIKIERKKERKKKEEKRKLDLLIIELTTQLQQSLEMQFNF